MQKKIVDNVKKLDGRKGTKYGMATIPFKMVNFF